MNGFLTICSGVVLLQLSKSAKDVPDAAVFSGDLDQIQTIAEQEQPETEPKADAIRGTAAIVRRLSSARMRMEFEELKRLHEEKRQESLEPVSEDGPQFEWDGLRRRRTTMGSQRARSMTSPSPMPSTLHPPLGWSRFPTQEELAAADRPVSPALSSIVGTIRSRARSVLASNHPETPGAPDPSKVRTPVHPVQLTEIVVPGQKDDDDASTAYDPGFMHPPRTPGRSRAATGASATSSARRVQFGGERGREEDYSEAGSVLRGPTPPPHSFKRQFSFQNIFRRHQAHEHGGDGVQEARNHRPITSRGYSNPQVRDATEEERLGLVQGDSRNFQSMPTLQHYDDSDDYAEPYVDDKESRYGPSITHSPPRQKTPRTGSNEKTNVIREEDEVAAYQQQRQRFKERSRSGDRDTAPHLPPHRQRSPPDGRNDGSLSNP